MSRRPATFRESDLRRAIKVAKAAGWSRVVINPSGQIVLEPGEPSRQDSGDEGANEWDRV